MNASKSADLILHNGKITTLDPKYPQAANVAIKDGRIAGVDDAESYSRGPATRVIDLNGRRLVPGLNDSHSHIIRGGLSYNLELRWDGVPSLADALRMLKEQVQRTPPGQWVRVIGGWSEFQFAERRMPTLDEINAVSPETPVFVLHLYCRGLLNKAALRACGYTKDTPQPVAGEIQHDGSGNPTGLLFARPNAGILYATVGKQPKLPPEHQMNSSRHFMRELNRLGLTSLVDAGGGSQIYPDDYVIMEELNRRGEMTVRMAYNIFTQKPKEEKADFIRSMKLTAPGKGDDFYRCNGAGEMLVYSAADFEYFLQRYGNKAAERTPPVRKMLELGIPVGAGTDATRVASYNPWLSLYWLVSGKTIGGAPLYTEANRLSREEALTLYTKGSSWFSGESDKKGAIISGQLADLVALTDDYLYVPEEKIKDIESVLTVVGGKVVYGAEEFKDLGPPPLPVLPEWSPIKVFGGYGAPLDIPKAVRAAVPVPHHHHFADAHSHAGLHVPGQLRAGIKAAVPRYVESWGLASDCS